MKPQRIIRPDTAFSVGRPSTKKRPRKEDGEHLGFVRGLGCIVCGTHRNVDAAHIRMASPVHGKRETGRGEKPSDVWALPLCADHHTRLPDSQHEVGEQVFWARLGINPCDMALALFACSGDDDMAETIIRLQKARGLIAD